ncbi:MAG: SdrD B-like domain-containing protein [Planctomycetota bacterium]
MTGPDGTLYGLWSNDDGVQIHRYDVSTGLWNSVATVGDDAGLFVDGATLSFDSSGQGIVVFAGQDLSSLTTTSVSGDVQSAFNEGGDLFYATFDPVTNAVSADMPLFALTGADSEVSLLTLDNGDVLAVWSHQNPDSESSIYSSRWDAASQTWSAGSIVASAYSIEGRPAITMVQGVPTIVWSQISDTPANLDEIDGTIPAVLQTARYVDGTWTDAAEFSAAELVSTTRIAASADGDQSQVFTDSSGDLLVITRGSVAGGWSQPSRLSLGGQVAPHSVAIAYAPSSKAIAVWVEVVADPVSGQETSIVYYSSQFSESTDWSEPLVLSQSGDVGNLQLRQTPQGELMIAWTVIDSDASTRLQTAFWSAATDTFERGAVLAENVDPDSVSVGSVGEETVLLWRDRAGAHRIDEGLTYATLSAAGWGSAVSAASLVHGQITRRSANVSRAEAKAQAFDQYNLGIAYLLASQMNMAASLVTGGGIYLRAAGVLPFSPPEDCCECEKYDERTVGTDEGCGSSTEVDEENCIRITTYEPCVERPRDPNDILGPEGFGEERWIAADTELSYRIRFENAADATASAQLVEVTQTLDDDLALPTFGITGFGFRGYNFTVPNAPPFYTTVIDLTDDLGVLVEFTAGIDVATREAFWRLIAIDPLTGQPPLDPDLGLLIPNDEEGNGEGYLDYKITANSNVETGTRIDAEARIVFDTEAPIDTPPIFNTLDATPPESGVISGVAPEDPEFTVTWAGQDDEDGSGLASYTILVAENGEDYSVWLDETTATEAVWTGTPGSTYSFVSIAADNAGNIEGLGEDADWTVTLPGGVATLGDFVFDDINDNGIQDDGEVGVDGVTVRLFSDDGAGTTVELASTLTTGGGVYSFTDVPTDGLYFLEIETPTGFAIGQAGQGGDPTLDSDFSIDGRTASFTPALGDNLDFDAALVQLGSIGGTVWNDVNSDGILNDGETGLVGWTVYLDLDDDGERDPEEPTTLSSDTGGYQFTDLRPGTYVVAEEVQEGWVQTFPGEAGANAATGSLDRSYQASGSVAPIVLPGLIEASAPTESFDPFASPTAEWIGLSDLRQDERFADLGGGTVVVIDTGIDVDHPFFGPDGDGDGVADRIIYQYDFADDDGDASDRVGHGSHVTGWIAGQDADYSGIAPDASIIALKVFGDDGRGTFGDVERALRWVIENADDYAIDAVNLSIGDGMNWADPIAGYGISDELAALSDLGVISVAAAGNSHGLYGDQGLAFPAADSSTISVGAVWDSNRGGPWDFGPAGTDYSTGPGRFASFSQRDDFMLDSVAPGAILMGANQFGGVSAMRGTSMATPQVTGAALLAQQLARESLGRSLTTAEFRHLLRESGSAVIDGDDENDSVFNTGATFAGLDLHALAESVWSYDGTFVGTGYPVDDVGGPGNPGPANSRPNRYVIQLAPGQDRDTVDFGNQLADSQAPAITNVSTIDPNPRMTGVESIEVTFSEPLDASTVSIEDFSLADLEGSIDLASATLTTTDSITWQLSGLLGLTTPDGRYTLTVNAETVSDLAGNSGAGSASVEFTVDATAPTGTVTPLNPSQTSGQIPVTVGGTDPLTGGVASGVAAHDVYVQIDGGPWTLWDTLPASDPSGSYAAQSNQTLGFYAIAIDEAGNREPDTNAREVATFVGDIDAPVTAATSVDASTPSLVVDLSGSDTGGSGLAGIELFVSVDGLEPRPVGRVGAAVGSDTSNGQVRVPAIQDGQTHTYRFFSVGTDNAGNVEMQPGGDGDVSVMVAFDPPGEDAVTGLRVGNTGAARSYVRNVGIDLTRSELAAAILSSLSDGDSANDRMLLTRRELDGSGPAVDVPLSTLVSASGNALEIDFGEGGIGGNRNSNVGDGYYELRLDVDGDSANGNETLLTFYRLLGDATGDGVVDGDDVRLVNENVGAAGPTAADINGDETVNVIDRALVSRASGRALSGDLPITDPATLGDPRVLGFDVQSGQTQRSYLQTIQTELSNADLATAVAASLADQAAADRLRLERFKLDGTGPGVSIDLDSHVSAVDQVLRIDFGSGGIPGGGNSSDADGYYRLSIDLDGDVSNGYEAELHFHRLLGDVTGDGVVDALDVAAVNAAVALGSNPEADVNGDGQINVVDRALVSRAQGRQIDQGLQRDD